MTKLCDKCNAELTSADWEAGLCTQCGYDMNFTEHLGNYAFAQWNGQELLLGEFRDGEGTQVVFLAPEHWPALQKFILLLQGVLTAKSV